MSIPVLVSVPAVPAQLDLDAPRQGDPTAHGEAPRALEHRPHRRHAASVAFRLARRAVHLPGRRPDPQRVRLERPA